MAKLHPPQIDYTDHAVYDSKNNILEVMPAVVAKFEEGMPLSTDLMLTNSFSIWNRQGHTIAMVST
jgi:hypothetical protein